MKKLTRTQLKERDKLLIRLSRARDRVEVNDTTAVKEYNEAIVDANIWRDEVAQAIQDYIDGKSERWQEGDKGQVYLDWLDEILGVELEPIRIVNGEPYLDEVGDAIEALQGIQEEVEE